MIETNNQLKPNDLDSSTTLTLGRLQQKLQTQLRHLGELSTIPPDKNDSKEASKRFDYCYESVAQTLSNVESRMGIQLPT